MLKRQLHTILLAMATLSCAAPGATGAATQPPIAIDQGAAGSTVALRQGQRLIVSLPANPTTGFVWQVALAAEPVLAQRGEPQFTPESTKLGAGGVYRCEFQAVAAGSGRLKFILKRSFEKDTAPAGTFEVGVTVD